MGATASHKSKICSSTAGVFWEFGGERESWLLQPLQNLGWNWTLIPHCADSDGCSPLCSPGLLAGKRRFHQSADKGSGCWTTASPDEFRSSSSQKIPGQQTLPSTVAHPAWALGTTATQAVLTCKNTSYYHELGPPQPTFLIKIRIVPLQEAVAPDFCPPPPPRSKP